MHSKLLALGLFGLAAADDLGNNPNGYTVVDPAGSDNFDAFDLASSIWTTSIGEGDEQWWGTAPSQFNDANIKGTPAGTLLMRTRQQIGYNPQGDGIDDDCDCGIPFGNHSSSLLVSKDTFTYGYFEATITPADISRADGEVGVTTSFWLQGEGGEINIADVFNSASGSAEATNDFHCWNSEDGSDTVSTANADDKMYDAASGNSGTLDGDNTYGVLWTAESITFYLNGVEHRTISKDVMTCIDTPMYMILSTETDFTTTDEVEAAGDYLTKSFVDNVGRFTFADTTPAPPAPPLADCLGDAIESEAQCLAILGPEGGAGACRYNSNRKRCVNDGTFVDGGGSEPEPEIADCLGFIDPSRESECLAIVGPNGGSGACRFNSNKNKCVNDGNFVDNGGGGEPSPPPTPAPELADCLGAAIESEAQCLAILGPEGGAGACRYNSNRKRCVNDGTFVDNGGGSEPEPEMADCLGFINPSREQECLDIVGPNGGSGACRFNSNKNKCVNDGNFVDNGGGGAPTPPPPPAPELADCLGFINPSREQDCLDIVGPNGGSGACRFNANKNKCVNDKNFVDNQGRRNRDVVGVRGREYKLV